MRTSLPSYDQILELPRSTALEVPEEFVDHNGHMNVRRYLGIQDDAGFSYFTKFGFGAEYVERQRRGFFDLEHHLRYHAEVMLGHQVAIHPRLLARSHKVVHVMAFMVNATTRRLANTFEVTMAHVDLEARRTIPFSESTALALDRQVEADDRLAWPAPTCGVMGVR